MEYVSTFYCKAVFHFTRCSALLHFPSVYGQIIVTLFLLHLTEVASDDHVNRLRSKHTLCRHFVFAQKKMLPDTESWCFYFRESVWVHADARPSPSKVSVPLCLHRKSNWITDRMKKLIKPRGGGREGRAAFTAAGSVENLADGAEYTSDAPKIGEARHTSTNTKISSDWFSQRYAHMLLH